MPYIYEDEDNEPMNGEVFDRIDQNGHNPTVYGSYAEMKAVEKGLPFTDPPENCHEYCPYAKKCRYAEGVPGLDPENCDMYYRIDEVVKGERNG